MPSDSAQGAVVVTAPPAQVLEVIRDVGAQAQWVPQVTAAQVLERNADGTAALASFSMRTPVGDDEFTLAFTHQAEAMSWVLVSGKLQQGQRGQYRVRDLGDGRTEVSLDLTVEHQMAVPGFLRRTVFQGFVDGPLGGLRQRVHGGS